MELLKGFPIQKYLDKKPPSDNSTTTKGEIQELTKLPIREKFIREKDDIIKSFEGIVGKDPIIQTLIYETHPIVLKIKKHHNRPRPKVIAKKMKTKMKDMEMASMNTPSYPSGHSVQGILIAKVLADKYPNKKDKLKKMGRDISYSRRSARAHYKSDSTFGEQIGNDMYNYIKDKI
mgnify:CR=1 FL=1|tara:strand:+ start:350 stop:877 length:528 start_codon:yes stop_codon:yes gene_type:complete